VTTPIDFVCAGTGCQSRNQCLRYSMRAVQERAVYAAFWARREAGASGCDSFMPVVQVEGGAV